MYQYLDQPVDRLDAGSRFILQAMRLWVIAVSRRTCPPRALATDFADVGALGVVGDLHRAMLTLHCHGLRPLHFGMLDRPSVTEAEALLLSLWASVVADRTEETRATLELVVREPAVAPILAWMVRVSAELSTLGLAPAGRLRSLPTSVTTGQNGKTQG